MSTIVVFGGTGYTGGNIVGEAGSRGHQVISVSRSEPQERIEGVVYTIGAAEDVAPKVIPGADAVVAALAPRGDMAGRLVEVYEQLARLSAEAGARPPQGGRGRPPRPPPPAAARGGGGAPHGGPAEAPPGGGPRGERGRRG